MSLEIERKFLLAKIPDVKYKLSIDIFQIYTPEGIRYREQREKKFDNNKFTFFKTIKTFISEGINEEIEIEITEKEWEEIETLYYSKVEYLSISKTRHIYIYNDLKFEIDEFKSDLQLVMMEVELPNLDHEFEIPEELKKYILMEVTGKKEFNNSYLAKL